MIRTLLVDDEPIARQNLREELALASDVHIIGEADNGRTALEQIHLLRPDLVFLDFQMPEMDGFQVVRRLSGPALPHIVFVTAYDQYAIAAFEAGAVDYLLKPVSEPRMQRCLARIRTLRKAEAVESLARLHEIAPSAAGPSPQPPRRIAGRAGDEFFLLESSDVLAFQAERELVWIITGKQRYLATQPLKSIAGKLQGLNFARVHRSCLVNLDHVAKVTPLTSQRWLLTLDNQQEIVVSKRHARSVRALWNW